MSRSALNRCQVRHEVGNLRALRAELRPALDGHTSKPLKTFKHYETGFVYIDINNLSQMSDVRSKRLEHRL